MQKIPSTGTESVQTKKREDRHNSRDLNDIEMHRGINKHMMENSGIEKEISKRDKRTGVDGCQYTSRSDNAVRG